MKIIFFILICLIFIPSISCGIEEIDSLKLVLKESEGLERINVLIELADTYNMSETEEGLTFADEAIKLAKEINDNLSLASAQLIRAGLLIRQGDFDVAEKDLTQAMQYFQESQQDSLLAKAYSNSGLLNRSKGDLDKALEYYEKSMQIKQDINDELGIATILSGIGLIYYDKGDLTTAKEYLEEALKIEEIYGTPASLSHCINNLGLVNLRLGEYETAMMYYKEGMELAEKYDFKLIMASIYNNMANIYYQLGDFEKAKETLYSSLDIYRLIGNKQNTARTINNLSILLQEENKFEETITLQEEALHIRIELGNKLEIANSYRNIAGLYEKLEHFNKAIEYFQEAYTLYAEVDNIPYKIEVLNEIGFLYYKSGEYKSSIDLLSQAYGIATANNYITTLKNITHNLASAYSAIGNFEKAYRFISENSDIKDSLALLQNEEQLNKLRVQFETEAKEHENQILLQDLAISQLEKDRLSFILIGSILLLVIIIIFFVSRIKINQHLHLINKDLEIAKENSEQIREQIALVNKIMRHDLTNSFVVIQSALDLYRENEEDEMLDEISKRCDTSLDLIRNMRMVEIGRKKSEKLLSINIRDIIEDLKQKFSEPKIAIAGHSIVLADEALESVFTNVIENAKQHGKAKNIKITITESLEFTIITISNNGSAIPVEIKDNIFDEGITSGLAGHTGLGLFLVRQNINRYGGSILLTKNEEHNVTFEINLKKGPRG